MSKEHNCQCGHDHDHDQDHNCGCGCGHDHEHDHAPIETLTLTLDDDTEKECYILGIFDAEDREYIALLPVGEEDVYLYRYSEAGEEEVILDAIESDDEYERVGKIFMELCDAAEEVEE